MRVFQLSLPLMMVWCSACQNQEVRHTVKKFERGNNIIVSDRIIAKPKEKPDVQLRTDLAGLSPHDNIDTALSQNIHKLYSRDIKTYKVEPDYKEKKERVFSISPEDDAPLQIFLKPVK